MKYVDTDNPLATQGTDHQGGTDISEQTLDMGTFDGMRSVMEDDFNDLIEAFYLSSEQVFATMDGWDEWFADDEYRRYPHSLKSIAGNIGAMTLKELAAQCEAQITEDTLADAQATYVLIREEYERVKQQLDSLGFAQAS